MRRIFALCTAVALTAGGAVAALGSAHAAGAGTQAPQRIIANHPDPEIIKVGDTYYSYATNNGRRVPVRTSKSLTGGWQDAGDAMPANAAWSTGQHYWAPDVLQLGARDFRLYFTARHKNGRQCIGVARAGSPLGPFRPEVAPIQCNTSEGGAIDASTFRDSDGTLYLLYKNDGNAIGKRTTIWLQRLSADGMRYVGGRRALISNTAASERGIIEAPVMVKRGGRYVLLYSAGQFWNDSYHTTYATASSLSGPWNKAFRPLMDTASVNGKVKGPGGQDVISDAQGDHLVFHGHVGKGRDTYVADLGFPGGYPVVRGSRVRYEAERGGVHRAKVVNGSRYSQGRSVGFIDHADSWVDVTVWVPTTGNYSVNVAYDAGYGDATHKVFANGKHQGDIKYLNTGWGIVRQSSLPVQLKAGSNTIRLQKGARWAQVDHIEVA